uniref:Peroxisomal membrane protein PEX14 n=1 Tax=Daphnia atkinsoni TaxID=342845 RepID=A0A4Y7M2C9_9CRUS|nr:EOG090X0FQ8 [Daphnia atkinsoni]
MSDGAETINAFGNTHRHDDNAAEGNIVHPLREDLISTAVKFLQNPRVATRPRTEKEVFLQRKGLNHAEIAAAFEASGTIDNKERTQMHNSSVKLSQLHDYSPALVPRGTKWGLAKDILNATILIAGAAYSLRYLYRQFIEPFLFGHKKKKTLEDTVEEMNKNLTSLVGNVAEAVQNLSDTVVTHRTKQNEQSEIKELKAEMASLKAILLGRLSTWRNTSIVCSQLLMEADQEVTGSTGSRLSRAVSMGITAVVHGAMLSIITPLRLFANNKFCGKISRCFADKYLVYALIEFQALSSRPTMKLATQLTVTAIAVAIGRAEELNSSVTRNQGMEPGPVAKNTT